MKKSILAVAIAAFALISCNKTDNQVEPSQEGSHIVINFKGEGRGFDTRANVQPNTRSIGQPTTRAFFDNVTTAEPWEKKLNHLTIFVFTASDGKQVLRRDMTSAELASGSVRFSLPWSSADKLLRFYAVANYDLAMQSSDFAVQNISETTLKTQLDVECGAYNGTVSAVFTKAKRTEGFTMSAVKDVQFSGAANSVTTVAMTLKRTVAKVAMRVTVDDEFAQRYKDSGIKITNVSVLKSVRTTHIFTNVSTAELMNMTLSQAPNVNGDTYESLFYLFENGARLADNLVTLKIDALFDLDSDFATTGDQSVVSYNVKLNAKNGGAIARNGYYRVDASLRGLDEHQVDVSIKVSDWEGPVNQTETLGN